MRIAIITHEHDRRPRTALMGLVQRSEPVYQIEVVAVALRRMGHRCFHTHVGLPFRDADAAILHCDGTVVPADVLALAARYPVCLNGATRSIEKRLVSRNLLSRDDGWRGPVIVKSNLNVRGGCEMRQNAAARAAGRPAPHPGLRKAPPYRLLDRLADVPDGVWSDPALVVERFRPEIAEGRYVLRIWSFAGPYERCSWYRTADPIGKGADILSFGVSEIPDVLRAERRRLGFDYGKFDFALAPDGPVLFDANRTPGFLATRPGLMWKAAPAMARGLLAEARRGTARA